MYRYCALPASDRGVFIINSLTVLIKKTSAHSTSWRTPFQIYRLNAPSFSLSSPVTYIVANNQIHCSPTSQPPLALKPKLYLVRGIQVFLKTLCTTHALFFIWLSTVIVSQLLGNDLQDNNPKYPSRSLRDFEGLI